MATLVVFLSAGRPAVPVTYALMLAVIACAARGLLLALIVTLLGAAGGARLPRQPDGACGHVVGLKKKSSGLSGMFWRLLGRSTTASIMINGVTA